MNVQPIITIPLDGIGIEINLGALQWGLAIVLLIIALSYIVFPDKRRGH